MILRNRSTEVQELLDGREPKSVAPNSLVLVSEETGFRALTQRPQVWTAEPVLVPPPPSPPPP